MLNQIFALLGGAQAHGFPKGLDPLQVAVAALMVHAASMDDVFDQAERAAIERLLSKRFALDADAARALLAAAELASEQSSQLYAFTRLAVERMNEAERIGLIEMLWEVGYADGVLDADEDALIRRVAGLIYVSDRDRGDARKRVLRRLNIAE
jgi:uncharacterized tellurite resistance protein B-like protein